MLDVETEMLVDAHVLIGNPDEGEEGNQVSVPVATKSPPALRPPCCYTEPFMFGSLVRQVLCVV